MKALRAKLRSLRPQISLQEARALAAVFGGAIVAIGIGLFDYRFGLIVAGCMITGGALYGATKR